MEQVKITLETIDLTKKFGKTTALEGVCLQLHEGEIYGYIGPNGAGKTTTIRLLLGSLKPTAGCARIFGLDTWKDAAEIHRRIAYVPGELSLWPNMTGGEVIDLFLRLHGTPDCLRRDALLEEFALDPTKKCRAYSKGNRQKISLVCAFAMNADLLLLDEPTSGLDPLMEQVFLKLLAQEKQNGKTVLLSSHILSEVERVCDRIGILQNGRLVESGTLEEMRHLSRTAMTIETQRPVEHPEMMEGVSDMVQNGRRLAFSIEESCLPAVLSCLAGYGITRIENTPPTLEDVFMRHYRTVGGAQG
ncbi:MAG: ABC transporter ATP-binding protein [Eubacteriales bacterium]|nr:ABC transporter ATP-binding protein [Eubacteriales bacterium]